MRSLYRTPPAWLLIVLSLLGSLHAGAQDVYPSRPIRMVVPFPPGGLADALSRIVAEKIAVKLGQPIIIENKPGASGNIGAEMVANAKPDGYTLLSTPPPPLVINQTLYPGLPFDPAKFVPITVMAATPNLLVVNPKVQANTIDELINHAKANPGKLNYGSTGSGGTPHLTTEWFKAVTGADLTHVPYKGAQAYQPLLSGEVDLMFMNIADALPYVRSGKLKPLAIGSEKRSSAFPDVPALSETLPGFVSMTWFAVAAPPGTPPPIALKLSAAIAEVLQSPEIAKRLADLSMVPIGNSPQMAAAFLKEETDRWGRVIRTARIKPD